MTVEFKKEDQKQMTKWIGGRKKYKLLYKASRDGCTATAFHNTCNNKGPNVTILYNKNNFIYGGYTSLSWKSVGNYQVDTKSFLFRLYQNGNWKPVQMPVNNTQNSIYDNASYGPTFGAHDLHAFTNTINFDGQMFSLNGSATFGTSYTMNGETYKTIADGNLQVKDIEVYQVEDIPVGAPLDEPWRRTPEWNTKVRKSQLHHQSKPKPRPIPKPRIVK